MSKNRFEDLLAEFISVTGRSMECARELAEMTIISFAGPNKDGLGDGGAGNLSKAQAFLDAMTNNCRNYVRREAYLKWFGDHAPIKFDRVTGKIVKDRTDDAVEFQVDEALKTSFWEYLPEMATKEFDTDDVIVALQRTIAKYSKTTKDGKPRFKAKDGTANSTLALASTMVGELKLAVNDDLGAGRVRTPTFGETESPGLVKKGNAPIKLPDASDVIPTAEKATAAAS
jgi:hypothetical protein